MAAMLDFLSGRLFSVPSTARSALSRDLDSCNARFRTRVCTLYTSWFIALFPIAIEWRMAMGYSQNLQLNLFGDLAALANNIIGQLYKPSTIQ